MKQKKILLKSAYSISAVASLVLFFSCNRTKPETVQTESTETVYAVNTYRVSPGNLDAYLEFGGNVAAVSSVSVLPDMAGKISRVLVNVGDTVRRDQVIAYVDASRPGMNYSQSPVKAPIAGRVTSFTPSVGAMVSQSMPIAQISSTDDLEIDVSVAERFVSRIQTGQKATISFDAYPGVDFSATVTEVSPTIDLSSRTMESTLRLDPPDERIKIGMYGRVKLITESIQNALVVPSNAIITREGNTYLFILSGGLARLQSVTVGITVDNKTEITEGLRTGDEVVIKGQALLNDGSKVNVISTER